MGYDLLPCDVKVAQDLTKSLDDHDALCILSRQEPSFLSSFFEEMRKIDKGFDSGVTVFKVPNVRVPVVYAPLDEVTDYQDVRVCAKPPAKALQRAVKAGAKNPLLVLPNNLPFTNAELISILGALAEAYVPIQLREDVPEKKKLLPSFGVYSKNPNINKILAEALSLERALFIARDIGVGDPERMSPVNVEKYLKNIYPDLFVRVVSDVKEMKEKYPLFEAVNRAADAVPRHRGRIIFLEYKPPSPARKSLLFVAKGVTYDTGGADIKHGGCMAGMCRDICGAGAVAGFMHYVQQTKPKDVHVIAALSMVRNSIGEECYVSDEVITSRAGVRVRVANTDAEGRMVMADPLCEMKELAQNLPDPHIFTVATLTGHVWIAYGDGYSAVLDNSVARAAGHGEKLKKVGEEFGDPFEISTVRQDDFDFIQTSIPGEDIIQSNDKPSSCTPRGHQFPCAFLITASGLDKHGLKSEKPLKYSHLDIAGSAGIHPNMPTGAPIIALVKTHLE